MNALRSGIAAAQKSLARLAEASPLLGRKLEAEAVEMINAFLTSNEAFVDRVYGKMKDAYWELLPDWISCFQNHPRLLKSAWQRANLEGFPPSRAEETETEFLRRALLVALGECGRKKVQALIRQAAKERAIPAAPETETSEDLRSFLTKIGHLPKEEALALIGDCKKKFLRRLAEFRHLPYHDNDTTFVRRLHESAVHFVRNTAI